jgi:hypothetical protein
MDALLKQLSERKKACGSDRKAEAHWSLLESDRCAQLNAASRLVDTPYDRYIRLWRAALGEAASDYHKGKPGIYTFVMTKGFDELCERAGFEPGYVRRKLKQHRLSDNFHRDLDDVVRDWMEDNGYDID